MDKYQKVFVMSEDGELEYVGLKKENESIIFKQELSPKQKAIIDKNNKMKYWAKEWGGFVTMCYVKDEVLFNKINISDASIPRIIYLSTYMDYNDRQEGLLIKKKISKGNKHLQRNDIKEILKLNDSTFKKFLKEMKDLQLLFQVEDRFYINTKYFTKGKCNFEKGSYTRIFIDTLRNLYEHSETKQHRQLSYVFKLIPFMNYETNILCKNTYESDIEKLELLGLNDICKLLKLNHKNAKKIERDLLKFYVVLDGVKYHLFSRAVIITSEGQYDYFVINPSVTWKGSDMNAAEKIIKGLYFRELIDK